MSRKNRIYKIERKNIKINNLKLRKYLGRGLLEGKKTSKWKLRHVFLQDALNALVLGS